MYTGRQILACSLLALLMFVVPTPAKAESPVVLNAGTVLYTAAKPGDPLYRAVLALQRDMRKVVGTAPAIKPLSDVGTSGIVVRGPADTTLPKTVGGPESHHLYLGTINGRRQLILEGADVRGEIYAVYTLSEKVLGVPPFWYYSEWRPGRPRDVVVPADFDLAVPSPQVRYRAWFPNDTDLFAPWRKLSTDNSEMWLEAALRLKLNTIEWFDGGRDYAVPYAVSPTTRLISDYGLINTTHHHSPLNASFEGWDAYWTQVRHVTPPPALSLANEPALEEFWRYHVDCVVRNHIDMLWVIGFRGVGDHPFWNTFKDAPTSMRDRGEVIGRMMRTQRDLVIRATGNPDAPCRTIFYNELSDLLALGDLHPPDDPAVIWTYVAARRDHYPNKDVQHLPAGGDRPLGYYFNYQFTSTGSHLAAAEGPWKMEQNLRYVAAKSRRPLVFSVVNAGNIREYVMELSAHATLLWDFDAYTSDRFLVDFCRTYYGDAHAARAAALYKAYYDAYWQQRRPDLAGIDRQYVFQDLRYKNAILAICSQFGRRYDPNPLHDVGGEQEKGRTFRIVPADSGGATTQVDAVIDGTTRSAAAFARVAADADALYATLDDDRKPFFNDNLRQPAHFMCGLNVCLLQLSTAYRTTDAAAKRDAIRQSRAALAGAEAALAGTQHGAFSTWYAGDHIFGFKDVREALARLGG